MEKSYLIQEKLTVTGPRDEINSLMIYLKNRGPNVHMIKSSPHFPFWDSITDLYLVVRGQELEETVQKIYSRLKSSSIYKGWIDYSQTFYPICASPDSKRPVF